MTGLGSRLRQLDARFAPPGPATPPAPAKLGWVLAALVLGLSTLGLLLVSVIGNPVFAFLLAPVGIVYGWVMGRLFEARAQSSRGGIARRP